MQGLLWPEIGRNEEDKPLRNELLCQLFRALRYQWISPKMKVQQPWQLKKSKSWERLWSYQPRTNKILVVLVPAKYHYQFSLFGPFL